MTVTLGEYTVGLYPAFAQTNAAPLLGADSNYPEDPWHAR